MTAVLADPEAGVFSRLSYTNARQGLLSTRNRLALYRRLERFAARGYDVKVPLEDMLARARERKRGTVPVIEDWLRALNNGERFSVTLGAHIPPAERMAIASGEETGRLDEGFAMAAYIVEANRTLRGAVMGSLAYPSVLLLAFIGLLVFVSIVLMPTLSEMFPVEFWPTPSFALYYISTAIRGAGLYVGIAGFLLAVLVVKTLPSWAGRSRSYLDGRIAPWSIYREVQSGMLLVTLSGLVQAGSPLDDALRKLKREASPWLSLHLEEMMRGIAQGQKPANAMNTGLFGEELMDDLLSYDRAGDLTESIPTLGRECVGLVTQRIKTIAGIASGLLMLAVGAGLVWSWGSFVLVFMAMRASQQF